MAPPADAAGAAALVEALADAAAEHDTDVVALGTMTDDEVAYLAAVDTLRDPDTEGVGCEGV